MNKIVWNLLLATPVILSIFSATHTKAVAQSTETTEQTKKSEERLSEPDTSSSSFLLKPKEKSFSRTPSVSELESGSTPTVQSQSSSAKQKGNLPQTTSVSQLSDVQPTDWAFVALQSLVERYGCIVGYPDNTYRGNRALSRYEFAAGLNSCLDQINRLIASSTADLLTKEELAALERLTKEFGPEIAELRGRVDGLEPRVAEVEANQFSTTTKLVGDAVFVLADAIGPRANNTEPDDTDDDSNTIFGYRARLGLQTSFTGRDQLTTSLTAYGIPNMGASTGTQMTRFTLDGGANYPDNDLYVDALYYRFPIGSKATAWVGTRTLNPPAYMPTVTNLTGSALNGAFSRFGQFNPTVYRPGFDGAGVAFAYRFSDQLQFHASYILENFQSNLPTRGLSNSTSLAIGQLTFSPSRKLDVALTYARKYYIAQSGFNLTGGTGSAFARNPFQQNATTSDNFGLQFNWRATPGFALGGWFGYTRAHQETGGDSEATILNGALTLGFPDLFKEGNLGGFVIGVPPKVTDTDYRVAGQRREDPDTSLHIEAFYRFRLNSNISVTPVVYVITKPEHNDANDPIWVGVLRTSFAF
ncbi:MULTISPECIES: iron uptake porin [Nostocales]|uniref:Iron uptake porin n=3 Tax=Nostocales TaxID=1161 RepID=A0A0C1N2U9_9CYAN|nr:iron uptake porin [Tolypothrix bouteillei]KAF3889895.1 iron uptake porin [Tolypothrix bouteillei VB521301]